jgi:carbonic anhydrase
MDEFARGVALFQTKIFPRRRALFQRLAKAQTPKALFITCADSRVVPALITHSGPGELFVERNPGNMVPVYSGESVGVSASVEYAVKALKVPRVVICGHSDCGAVKAIQRPETLDGLPAVARWLKFGEPARLLPGGESGLDRLIENNVLVQMENLKTHPSVAAAIGGRGLEIHGWVYDIASGTVSAYDAGRGQFAPWPGT